MATSTAAESRALPPGGRARSFLERLRAGEEAAYFITVIAAGTIFLITSLIFYELWVQSALSRHQFGFHFLVTETWDPVKTNFGALPFIYGTVITSALALFIAIPLGLGSAIFLAELAPRKISDGMTFLIELLAAVPSVIYGLLGVFVLIPVLQQHVVPVLKDALGFLPIFEGAFYGVSVFSASVVLSVMIVPFIVSVSREVLLAVPRDQREAALGLGASKWQSTWRVVVPYATKGIMGSIFLALARALGETMAVTMVIGNTPQIKASLLAPGYSIAAVIANEFTEAVGSVYISSLIELGLVLFVVTFIINGLARLMIIATTGAGGH
jgi:phosphate transport system permease protein